MYDEKVSLTLQVLRLIILGGMVGFSLATLASFLPVLSSVPSIDYIGIGSGMGLSVIFAKKLLFLL